MTSADVARIFLQQTPGLVPEFGFPILLETMHFYYYRRIFCIDKMGISGFQKEQGHGVSRR
jgi:hypothetical protein